MKIYICDDEPKILSDISSKVKDTLIININLKASLKEQNKAEKVTVKTYCYSLPDDTLLSINNVLESSDILEAKAITLEDIQTTINEDNSISIISDSSLTRLAYGNSVNYSNSYVNKWLNKNTEEYSGILEEQLNEKEKYLQKTTTCLDNINELDNKECENTNNNSYISLLPTNDFVNIGNKESYVINNEYFYLNNTNESNEVWFVDNEGKVTTNKGTDIIGIRPVITIKANIDYLEGNGTKDSPYTIEKENGLFGSYVKLDNKLWRIYQVNETEVRLFLNEYLTINNNKVEHIYSNINSYHNDHKQGSLAFYLNNDFLNTMSFKDKIKEVEWSNGYYGSNSKYDYKESF